MQPVKSGYADVNGIELWHEVYGQGEPLVLIHGGLTTIGEMRAWVEELAKTRQVIAVEMQGHGHTTDTDADLVGVRGGWLVPQGAGRYEPRRRVDGRSRSSSRILGRRAGIQWVNRRRQRSLDGDVTLQSPRPACRPMAARDR